MLSSSGIEPIQIYIVEPKRYIGIRPTHALEWFNFGTIYIQSTGATVVKKTPPKKQQPQEVRVSA